MRMLDLCCGLGGASAAMRDRGWEVVTVDVDPCFNPTITADVRTISIPGPFDLVWASPPCTQFSRLFQRGLYPHDGEPDMTIVEACWRIIAEVQPCYWIVENVKGAIPYLGLFQESHGSIFLWGHFPPLGRIIHRKRMDSKRMRGELFVRDPAQRAMMPYALSLSLAISVESQQILVL